MLKDTFCAKTTRETSSKREENKILFMYKDNPFFRDLKLLPGNSGTEESHIIKKPAQEPVFFCANNPTFSLFQDQLLHNP